MNLLYGLDLFGTFVFAMSGALTAANKRFDFFGAIVIAFVTAVGGGTIRDVLIGSFPVSWMNDTPYLVMVALGIAVSFFFKEYVLKLRRTMFLFDTIGIGIFTIIGLQKTLAFSISPVVAVMMGTISAVFGGVIRDILCGEIPLIFRKEIYATPCILGGIFYWTLANMFGYAPVWGMLTIVLIIGVRILAVRKKWSLPIIR